MRSFLFLITLSFLGSCGTPPHRQDKPISLEARMNDCLLENGYSETEIKNLNRGTALHTNPYWHRMSTEQKSSYSKCKTRVSIQGRKYIQDTDETHDQSTNHSTGVQLTPTGLGGVFNENTRETKTIRKSFQIQSEP